MPCPHLQRGVCPLDEISSHHPVTLYNWLNNKVRTHSIRERATKLTQSIIIQSSNGDYLLVFLFYHLHKLHSLKIWRVSFLHMLQTTFRFALHVGNQNCTSLLKRMTLTLPFTKDFKEAFQCTYDRSLSCQLHIVKHSPMFYICPYIVHLLLAQVTSLVRARQMKYASIKQGYRA